MENYIIIAVLVLILGGAIWYIARAKKKGQKCIGCPAAKEGGCCNCQSNKK